MWNAVKEQIERRGGVVRTGADMVSVRRRGNCIDGVVVASNGHKEIIQGAEFISSMPVTEFIKKLDPPPPSEVLAAAGKLNYRDFLTVCLIVDKAELFPDNWIYIHDSSVRVGRIQNFKNWSPSMVPDPAKTSLGLEYFCTEGDELWNLPDRDLIELGKREAARIGLVSYADIEDGCVVRVPKAYPVYDSSYRDHLAVVREFVDGMENFQTIGRNGLHRYNNQDHAMLTGMLAVRNMVQGEHNDLWSVNTDQEYHEEIREAEAQEVTKVWQEALSRAFPKLDRVAFGLSLGTAAGLALALASLALVIKGGEVVGPTLQLLGQYFPGYSVTPFGSLLGLVYGFVSGFIGGWGFAFLRNASVFLYMAVVHRRAEFDALRRLLEYF
jgi:protoporphyrinogen oxidase